MAKTVAIILNGEALAVERAKNILQNASVVIAADGGANYCLSNAIIPDYIIGDLDSITQKARSVPVKSELIQLEDQYSTDLEKALNLAQQLNAEQLFILNATGQRSDHAVANLLFLQEMSKKLPITVFDNFGHLTFLHPGEHSFHLPIGKTVSFVSLGAISELTLQGFRYPLTKAHFNHFFVGISNVVESKPCVVTFKGGPLMMYEVEKLE